YEDFRIDLNRLEDAITPRTRLLILNSPANPTGMVYTREELQGIAQIARKHDLLIISDEIYEFYCYDEPFISMAGLYEKTLLIRGFSKSHAMTGWRIGWCTGPKKILEKMTMLQQYTFVCAPSMVQEAALTALETDMTAYVAEYRKKRDIIYAGLKDKFGLVKPRGAFYTFVPAPGGNATNFVEKAIANNVLIIPGNVFSGRNTHFRISYATTNEKLTRGIEILNSLA
ncbi:MAG TPA: aminotransferase class I/II-fold pyridoxal phosphate-dependent enzyme, partial [Phycisphaerae bacterium]|nr:aminotransferase class I/II-fold pyridoxal phosphate-dependent enzyme [Phycisphaerae bacterium]